MSARTLVGVLVAVSLAAAVVVGLVLSGPPSEARAVQQDHRRVDDLSRLARDIDVYWTRTGALPASLEALSGEEGLASRVDPLSHAPYEYRPADDTHFEVCAVFATESRNDPPDLRERFWAHGSGRQCFNVEVREAGRGRIGR